MHNAISMAGPHFRETDRSRRSLWATPLISTLDVNGARRGGEILKAERRMVNAKRNLAQNYVQK
jgi:hypothetical protein